MISKIKIIFSWVWPYIVPMITLLLKVGMNGIQIIIDEVVKANELEITNSEKFKLVFDNSLVRLKELGKELATSELNLLIELAVKILKTFMAQKPEELEKIINDAKKLSKK